MKKNENIKKILIDLLKLVFLANKETIDILSSITNTSGEVFFGEKKHFSLIWMTNKRYENAYCIGYYKGEKYYKFGTLKFNIVHTTFSQDINFINDKQRVWIDVENQVFYSGNDILLLNIIRETLNLQLYNINQIDLCTDRNFNIYDRVYRRNIKNKELQALVNGRVQDKDEILRVTQMITYGSLYKPNQIKTYYVKQKKAIKDKTKGNYLIMYNKKEKIDNTGKKNYILEYYGNPDVLHRLEVHICSEKIQHYLAKEKMIGNDFDFDTLVNQEFLKEMFDYFLCSLLRFRSKKRNSKGRKIKSWNVLLR